MPNVSVVLPTHNRLDTLKRSLASVLEQSYTDLEVIVVDDCSTDATAAYIKTLSDARVRYLQLSQNRGAATARNAGIQLATGEFIAFQDSDDLWLPNKLSNQLAYLEQNESLAVVFTSFVKCHPAYKFVMPPEAVPSSEIAPRLAFGNFIGTPTVLARRSVLLAAGGFDTELRNHEDWDLWLTLAGRGAQFHHLTQVLLVSPYSPDGVSDAQTAQLAEAFEHIYRKHLGLFKAAEADAHMNHVIGKLYSSSRPSVRPRGRPFLRRAATRAPLNPKYALFFWLSAVNPDWPERFRHLVGKR